jgi:hypothetical protein
MSFGTTNLTFIGVAVLVACMMLAGPARSEEKFFTATCPDACECGCTAGNPCGCATILISADNPFFAPPSGKPSSAPFAPVPSTAPKAMPQVCGPNGCPPSAATYSASSVYQSDVNGTMVGKRKGLFARIRDRRLSRHQSTTQPSP